jgi:hypothetical protein
VTAGRGSTTSPVRPASAAQARPASVRQHTRKGPSILDW